MRLRGWRALVALAIVLPWALAPAQTTVYESKDKAGPVFSDKPSPGAAVVDLPPPNVVQGPTIVPPPPRPAAAPPPYRTLAIASLADGATVHTNTGAFGFNARVEPALRANDRIRIRLDGNLLPATFRTTSLRIGELDWQTAARADAVEHTLQLAIVDMQGKVLIESAPIQLFVHRATVARPRS